MQYEQVYAMDAPDELAGWVRNIAEPGQHERWVAYAPGRTPISRGFDDRRNAVSAVQAHHVGGGTTPQVINLTPHAITIVDTEGQITRTIPPSGRVARVDTITTSDGAVDGIPVVELSTGQLRVEHADGTTGEMPPWRSGVHYIVSTMAADAECRPDLLTPAELLRDDQGRPIGCRVLASHIGPDPDLP